MKRDLMEAIFSGTRECGVRIRGLHIAGGEAFLNFPVLLEAVELAQSLGVRVDYVETNGHWFTTREDALDRLNALKKAGLGCIMVSASPQHAEYIPVWKTLGAIEACRSVFGPGGMFVWLPEFLEELSGLNVTGTVSWDAYSQAFGQERARHAATYGGQLVPGGRAGFGHAEHLALRPAEAWFGGNCATDLLASRHGHYDPYGNLLPASCSGISLGDAHDLVGMCKAFSLASHPILQTLVEHGVAGLYRLAQGEWGFQPLRGYAGKCHLCMDIRRHIVTSGGDFRELSPKQFYAEV